MKLLWLKEIIGDAYTEDMDARGRLICAESILEVAIEGCKDELKKKELQRQLELTRKALASLTPVD